ncbi:Crp/Fnr family transcriptional regulator [Leptolyngbya sp. NIES-2104]|uniref:Crp/Fnr family transcriptional regulator n=1 Tax=Leptolyngbya sp. NIES-2104 TaxID=1552121 RepID=UPI00073EFA06|nr:Crp/Fnr family transcriptional regulator [Leptolyngbya sp. NIES-2104]
MLISCSPPVTQRIAFRRSFQRREQIPLDLDVLWSIESGYVRTLTWDMTGTIVALGIWGKGDVVGRAFSKMNPYQIECLTPVEARQIDLADCSSERLFAHIQQVETLLSLANTRQVSTRLLRLLHWFAQRFGTVVDQGYLLNLPLTHQALSEFIGSTRVTVTRTLRELEDAGKLKQLRQHRILLSIEECRNGQDDHSTRPLLSDGSEHSKSTQTSTKRQLHQ